MTGSATHACPGGCGRTDVPDDRMACSRCWHRLPADLRAEVNRQWRRGPSPAYLAARSAAVRWWQANPGGTR